MAGFGDKKMEIGDSRTDGQVISDGGGDGAVDGNSAAGIIFQRADVNLVFPDIFQMKVS